MNLPTHVVLGLLIGAVFFRSPEIALLFAVGAAIPDLDREYGFFTRDRFRDLQIHRALFHNFLFLGLLYLVNPFLSLGAFTHTLLDALTTTKDRGVEWLFPFTRLTKRAIYDEKGDSVKLSGFGSIFFYQYDPIQITRLSDADLREYKQLPWRRTYGPAVSGKLLDLGIFVGAVALVIFVAVLAELGLDGFSQLRVINLSSSFILPVAVGIGGILVQLAAGEEDRRRQLYKRKRPEEMYKATFFFSIGLMLLSVALGAYLNPYLAYSILVTIPYDLVGVALVVLITFALVRFGKRLPRPFLPTADGHPANESTDKEEGNDNGETREEEKAKLREFDQSKVGERDDPMVI